MSISFLPASYPGTLHHYSTLLTAFEHENPNSASYEGPRHTVLFIGGIGDGLLHPTYPALIARRLPKGWSLAEVLLSSAYKGWAITSLARDARELAQAVSYIRTLPSRSEAEGAKIVLIGHSTGSQVCMEYTVGPWKSPSVPASTLERPKIDGVVLQAGISDREAVRKVLPEEVLEEGLDLARKMIEEGNGTETLPGSATEGLFGADPSAIRWLSMADVDGDDDYFSSDFSDERLQRTFGQLGERKIPLCIFLSGSDEYMPDHVDKQKLLGRWAKVVRDAGGFVGNQSCIVEGAAHNLNSSSREAREKLSDGVCGFVVDVASGRLSI